MLENPSKSSYNSKSEVSITNNKSIQADRRLDLLEPKNILKSKVVSFTKNPRPEIWPVKDEHSFPEHQYRNNEFINEKQSAGSLQYNSDR